MRTNARPYFALSAIAAALVACSAASDADEPDSEPSADDGSRAIKGGAGALVFPETVLLDGTKDGQKATCVGVLVRLDVVLTAGHCVAGFQSWNVSSPFMGAQGAAPITTTSGATFDWKGGGFSMAPFAHDIGLLFLPKSFAAPIGAVPAVVATAPLADNHGVTMVGRVNDGVDTGSLVLGNATVMRNEALLPFSYEAFPMTTQSGDSGGPVFDPIGFPHVVVAVVTGTATDFGFGVLGRTDQLAGWIENQIAAHSTNALVDDETPPEDPCQGVTFEGQCDGAVLSWCEDGLKVVDCAEQGLSCAFDESNQFFNCI